MQTKTNSNIFGYKKRYFDDDDAEVTPDLAYIPAPGSPSADDSIKV